MTRTSVIRAGLLLGLCAADLPAQVRGLAPNAAQLLNQVLNPPEITYQGRITVTHWYGRQTRAEEVMVYFAPSNRRRLEFLLHNGNVGRVVISDGSREELRLPRRRKVLQGDAVKSSSKIMSREVERELLMKNYAASFLGEELVAGRSCWVLELAPVESGKPRLKLSIDKETGAVLENKKYHLNGNYAALSRFTRFEIKTALPEDLFQLTSDSSGRVDAHGLDPDFLTLADLNKAVGKRSNIPSDLPGGFVFESADFFKIQKETVRQFRYTDGSIALSVFQTDRPVHIGKESSPDVPSQEAVPGSLRLSSSGKMLHWKSRGYYYTLIGDLSRELLERIASRLKRSAN